MWAGSKNWRRQTLGVVILGLALVAWLQPASASPSGPAQGSAAGSAASADDPAKARIPCVSSAAIARARAYAEGRPGRATFAVFVGGSLRSSGGGIPFRSASVVKAMLLVAELRRHARSGKPLTGADRGRLGAMIRVSDNGAASRTFDGLGSGALRAVARAAGMRNYTVGGYWGTSRITAADQARLMGRLNTLLPAQYRAYGRKLLREVVGWQSWGGVRAARSLGYRTMSKSGWLPQPSGWVVHQSLRLERGRCVIGVAVLTGRQPSMATGVTTIRGVTQRLLGFA